MEENDCPICLTPLIREPCEIFTHINERGGAPHYVHSACQLQYINSQRDERRIKCIICRGILGTPEECRNEILIQNRTVWQNISERYKAIHHTVISYLPSQDTVILSGLFLLSLATMMQIDRHREQHGSMLSLPDMANELPNQNEIIERMHRRRSITTGLFVAVLILTRIGPRGGTRRRNKKMTRHMRGGNKKMVIDSPESLLSFLDIISKINEPYYVILTGPNVIDFLEILNINTDNIRIAHLDIDSNKVNI
jgi:hypothetical protein